MTFQKFPIPRIPCITVLESRVISGHLCDGTGVGLVFCPLLLDWYGVLDDPDGASGRADDEGAARAGDGDGRVYCFVSTHLP